MEERFDKQTQERAVLVGLNADCFAEEDTATESTLDELEDLLETAGGFCTGKVLQNRHTPDSHSFIGEGKAQEVRMLAEATQSTMVIFDKELSPANIRAFEEIIGLHVLDRSALILDIFAQRAKTKEGRLQVELAQYKYLLPRLSGMGTSLSRQGGGIGTRGPGETKLESDRRHIRERINRLEEELEQLIEAKKQVAEEIKIARGFGDLSENAEYDAAKKEEARVYGRLNELEELKKQKDKADFSDKLEAMRQ